MGKEFELKFGLTEPQAQTLLELLRECPQDCRTLHMETTYYDTPAADLSARHWTLRRRMENDRSVCTVKTPVRGLGRGEWETDCTRIADAVPELVRLGAPEALVPLTAAGLVPVCGARFTRIFRSVLCCGARMELALDRGVLLGGGRETPLLEFEMELKEGSEAEALAAGREFEKLYGLVREPRSKFRRALDLAKGER